MWCCWLGFTYGCRGALALGHIISDLALGLPPAPSSSCEWAENCCGGLSGCQVAWSNTSILDLSTSNLAFLLSRASSDRESLTASGPAPSHMEYEVLRGGFPLLVCSALTFALEEKWHGCFLLQHTESLLQQFPPSCRLLPFLGRSD